ncbi:MAG: Acyl carrier protein [Candidatus Falkowbacteria bacterium GW2011_GWC2_38_22]|uniref:Acyl carrier protein n=1 Tax=Candidatus Falkowbacteria bacterium GW2011_GWE1_38_31 TaxID=1618638 RepID=A0A0G0M7Z2_9BACT|nr:MAG: Acyl carrier protein [Candidatus Falkowbacteria bacterium GW2011_GWF2_38_1205]KKQ60889.1 MAG: Acyl carrier protein [Candidatus Falkowbacteria bacterium GW2011_GWC2_38_22]KKQ63007.1 MAG: Acyl carrier protein [Candidatus Falkowbacteria bacterium GW2011_GWF1_38_22]KKQ65029.1 MAG: Acyl carrier protein [Candidatus Falkowbacteria bacterium GW2011_GWE2_38_254]KKQ69804.1 MAG: Acyl carrier protein [Candidatus Falkowbacteria bacterium GW2011_GWE1_38_31]KKQ72386.1 MAG: Acyl carrier protein [Candi
MPDNIQKKTIRKIAEISNFKPENIGLECSIIKDLYVDSINFVELLASLEEIFDIDIDEKEINYNITVEELINLVRDLALEDLDRMLKLEKALKEKKHEIQ